MSSPATSRSDDIVRLAEAGYEVSLRKGHLILSNVPYRTAEGTVARGTLVSGLKTSNGTTVPPTDDHQVWFQGSVAFDANGNSLEPIIALAPNAQELLPGVHVDFHLSHKIRGDAGPRHYVDYFEKLSRYAEILGRGARSIDPEATAMTHAKSGVADDYSVFHYPDTSASRAGIVDFNERLALDRVAIVGLGGTGSYILDFVAKTPVVEIHIFDGDVLEDHNAFRAPGAASGDDLDARQHKVHYFNGIYSRMRDGIVPHPEFIDNSNVEALRVMDYVFLSMDGGEAEKAVAEKLLEWGIPFVSVGMGVTRRDEGLAGMLRTSSSTAENPADPDRLGAAAGAKNEYASNIQVAELNALNAAQAVLRWKKHFGFYVDEIHESRSLFFLHQNKLVFD